MGCVQEAVAIFNPGCGSQSQTKALGGWQEGDHRRHEEILGAETIRKLPRLENRLRRSRLIGRRWRSGQGASMAVISRCPVWSWPGPRDDLQCCCRGWRVMGGIGRWAVKLPTSRLLDRVGWRTPAGRAFTVRVTGTTSFSAITKRRRVMFMLSSHYVR